MMYRLTLLPGDGVGPEVIEAACRVLDAVCALGDVEIEYTTLLIGGAAIDAYGTPLRDEDLAICRDSEAVLLGAVGGPEWDQLPVGTRPERGLLRLRSELGLCINLRPVTWTSAGGERSPLKATVADGADIAFVRELSAGIYFGRPSYYYRALAGRYALDTAYYTEQQVSTVLDFAFSLARSRGGKVTSVDKANVMNTSRMWRDVATEYGRRHPDVELEHALVDSFTMSLMQDPRRYDVVVTENLFGDIITDLAAVIAGSLGMLPSASLNAASNGCRFGIYEPVHGSAPDIAGRNLANPVGGLLSVALMLEWTFGRPDLADLVRHAVRYALDSGMVTADLAGATRIPVDTQEFIDSVVTRITQEGHAVERRHLRHHVA